MELGDFFVNASRGIVGGSRIAGMVGVNPDLDTASLPEDIWFPGGLFPWQSTAQALEMVSTSANDAAAGTGARTVVVQGLDADYREVTQVVTLNGTTPVALTTPLLRRNALTCVSVGSGRVNAGDITLRLAGAGATQGFIPTAHGRCPTCVFTVPLGKTAFFVDGAFGFLKTTANDYCEMQVLTSGFGQSWIVRNSFTVTESQGTVQIAPRISGPVAERSDVVIRAVAANASNLRVQATLTMLLTDN